MRGGALKHYQRELQGAEAFQRARGRPMITLAYAQSVDGGIASPDRDKLYLSSEESLTMAHRLRACNQGVLLGSGTALREDPLLTVRKVKGEDPVPVILDTHLRMSPKARMLQDRSTLPILVVGDFLSLERRQSFPRNLARILPCPCTADKRIDLTVLVNRLAKMGISRMVVEGGIRVITSFVSLRIVDWLAITVTPFLAGGLPAISELGPRNRGVISLSHCEWEQVGTDLFLLARPDWRRGQRGCPGVGEDTPEDTG